MRHEASRSQAWLVHGLAGLLLLDMVVLCAIGAVAFVAGHDRFFRGDLFLSLFLVGMYTTPALIAAGLIRRGASAVAMRVAILLAATALGMSIWAIVSDRVPMFQLRLREAVSLTAATLCLLLVLDGGLRMYGSGAGKVRWARRGTLAIAGLTVALLLFRTWFARMFYWRGRLSGYDERVSATVVAGVVLTLIGALTVRALHRSGRRRHGRIDASLPRRVMLEMECPHCGEVLVAPMGDYRCPACRAVMEIEIEEPRCECGYLIYEHTSANCPECGREIPEEDRWVEERDEKP